MRRRTFITLLGGAAAWPVAARAQQAAPPVIGLLRSGSPADLARIRDAFRRGLEEAGLGENFSIEDRAADSRYDRLSALASELANLRVGVIVALGDPSAIAAKAITTTIPVVFSTGTDPVKLGLVASLNRPGGNLTGLSQMNNLLGAKRLELLRELVPTATSVAFLANPNNPNAEASTKDVQDAAASLERQLYILHASNEAEIESAFARITQQKIGALLIASDPFFLGRRSQIVAAAARSGIPTFYTIRDYAAAGGLISYAANQAELYRQTGAYAGRILRGAKPGDLPVLQPTKFDLVINLKTAKALGLDVPATLLARVDEVIE